MSEYNTVEVPFHTWGNKTVLYRSDIEDNPWLMDFVNQFKHCFRQDFNADVLIYEPPEDSK